MTALVTSVRFELTFIGREPIFLGQLEDEVMAATIGFEPTFSCVTGRRGRPDSPTWPLEGLVARTGFAPGLVVMSHSYDLRYQRANTSYTDYRNGARGRNRTDRLRGAVGLQSTGLSQFVHLLHGGR